MPTIRSVEACAVRVPLNKPTSFATRVVTGREYLLVRVTGEDGVTGIGFCYLGTAGGRMGTIAVREVLAPQVVGQDTHAPEAIWQAMVDEALIQGRAGVVMRAISAIDTAIWDRNARAAQLPLHKYLGAHRTETVPAYASGGYYLDGKSAQDLGRELAGYVSAGFSAVKMKVGRLGLDEEEERLRVARQSVGDDVLIMLDANNAWRDLPTALRFMDRYERYDPYWIEEPFSPDDIDSHAQLADRCRTTVATAEIEYGRWRHKELIEKGGAAILQTDAAVCGGITEFRRIAAFAACHSVMLCPHWYHDLHAPLVASIPNGQFVEFFIDSTVFNFRELIDRQLAFRNGMLQLHQEPGLGFDFDTAAVSRFATDAWG